jgi:hypothetical protein
MEYRVNIPRDTVVNGLLVLALAGLTFDWTIAADLEANRPAAQTGIHDGGATGLRTGDDLNYVEFYGQINKGYLSYDDGVSTLGYFPVDNSNSDTRLGIRSLRRLNQDWSIGSNLEAEWEPYSTGDVNQLTKHDVDWDVFSLRKAEIYIDSETYGRLWLGQGSMASDGTAESDLSGTSLAGYVSVSDIAGGQYYRFSNGIFSGVQVRNTFKEFDGLGRKFRARYDTPEYNGLVFGASVGERIVPEKSGVTVWDVAAKYNMSNDQYKFSGALAYFYSGGDTHGSVDGSGSVLHIPSGISLTVASAIQFKPDQNANYFYAKLGHQGDYFHFGKSAVSIDAYYGKNLATPYSESVSYGIQAVQKVNSWRTEFYLGIRSYEYNDNIDTYKNGLAVLAGTRIKF